MIGTALLCVGKRLPVTCSSPSAGLGGLKEGLVKILNHQMLNIDVLVFSSQKTATQTILNSLNGSGVDSLHGHTTDNLGLTEDLFKQYLLQYIDYNKKPLKIISIFRDPLERMVSSFFQSLSEDKYAYTHPYLEFPIHDPSENLLHKVDAAEILELFQSYCNKIDAWGESIATICKVMNSEIEALDFCEIDKIGINCLDLCSLYLLRFDLMLPCLAELLGRITKQDIALRPENLANTKYYFDQYRTFGETMALPVDLIERIYQGRKALMELFYPDQLDTILDARIRRYGR
jgi:hypothetical protein